MLADMLTKPLGPQRLETRREMTGIIGCRRGGTLETMTD